MWINCDIGERGADHPVDRELMSVIHIANVACGGHAGDADSMAVFRDLAQKNGVKVSAHLSYPDREGFGRRSMNLSRKDLYSALDLQVSRVPGVERIKFHGALYTDSARDPNLAETLVAWLDYHQIKILLCPPHSCLANLAEQCGIEVLPEAFLDRRYQWSKNHELSLVPRTYPDACISDISVAMEQAKQLLCNRQVIALDGEAYPLEAKTLCIHSDSPIALELAREVTRYLEAER